MTGDLDGISKNKKPKFIWAIILALISLAVLIYTVLLMNGYINLIVELSEEESGISYSAPTAIALLVLSVVSLVLKIVYNCVIDKLGVEKAEKTGGNEKLSKPDSDYEKLVFLLKQRNEGRISAEEYETLKRELNI